MDELQVTGELVRVVEATKGEGQNKTLCAMVKKIEDNMAKLHVFITQVAGGVIKYSAGACWVACQTQALQQPEH